ncbi:C-terminal processing peptidase [Striga asiatica]|uniref:C-terminal processing peptidase n=1 Tax=Striga asiatica TaxID=4170 RepID=A0A5A7PNE6_STRAF|nr:C-terminal processing peptidase [Striga asiatica]
MSSGSSSRTTTPQPRMCFHNLEAEMLTSNTDENPARSVPFSIVLRNSMAIEVLPTLQSPSTTIPQVTTFSSQSPSPTIFLINSCASLIIFSRNRPFSISIRRTAKLEEPTQNREPVINPARKAKAVDSNIHSQQLLLYRNNENVASIESSRGIYLIHGELGKKIEIAIRKRHNSASSFTLCRVLCSMHRFAQRFKPYDNK